MAHHQLELEWAHHLYCPAANSCIHFRFRVQETKTTQCTNTIVEWCQTSRLLFSPLGKLAGRSKYFACINFIFFIFYFFYYEQSYLTIYWTDFHDLFTKWKVFAWNFLICSSFSDSSRDVAMATNLVAKMGQNYLPVCTYRSVIPKRNGISPCKYAH